MAKVEIKFKDLDEVEAWMKKTQQLGFFDSTSPGTSEQPEKEFSSLDDLHIHFVEGRVEKLSKELRDTQNAFVNMVSWLTGTKADPCQYGDSQCAGDVSEEGMKIVDRVLSGEMKLYEVDEVNALKMTVEGYEQESWEIHNDLAMLLGVELKPCSSPCPGHLPKEAETFLSELRRIKASQDWPGRTWSQFLSYQMHVRLRDPGTGFPIPLSAVESGPNARPRGGVISADTPQCPGSFAYLRQGEFSGPLHRCSSCGSDVAVWAMQSPGVYRVAPHSRFSGSAAPAPFDGRVPCSCLKLLQSGESWKDMPLGRIAPAGLLDWSCLADCPVCHGTGFKPPATAVPDAVETRSEPGVGVGTTPSPEAPGEAATQPWRGIVEKSFKVHNLRDSAWFPNLSGWSRGLAKEAYEAGMNEQQNRQAVTQASLDKNRREFEQQYYNDGYRQGRRLGILDGQGIRAEVRQEGYSAGWAAALSSKEAEKDNTTDLYRMRTEFQPAVAQYKKSSRTAHDLWYFVREIAVAAVELGVAKERNRKQEHQIGESIAKDGCVKLIGCLRLGDAQLAYAKEAIEKVRNLRRLTGIPREKFSSYDEGRDDFANELLDLLEGKSLKVQEGPAGWDGFPLPGGDSMT